MTQTPEEKHLEVMVAIKGINTTLKKVVQPAVDQVWTNKDNITTMKTKQNGMFKVLWFFGLFIIGICSRFIYKVIHG